MNPYWRYDNGFSLPAIFTAAFETTEPTPFCQFPLRHGNCNKQSEWKLTIKDGMLSVCDKHKEPAAHAFHRNGYFVE